MAFVAIRVDYQEYFTPRHQSKVVPEQPPRTIIILIPQHFRAKFKSKFSELAASKALEKILWFKSHHAQSVSTRNQFNLSSTHLSHRRQWDENQYGSVAVFTSIGRAPSMVSTSANWLMFSSRLYRRVSRQSASINYIFAFCASLIIFCFASTVHAQRNDLRKMIKPSPTPRVMKSRIVIMIFRDDSRIFFRVQEFFNYICASFRNERQTVEIGQGKRLKQQIQQQFSEWREWQQQKKLPRLSTTLWMRLMVATPQKLLQLPLHDSANFLMFMGRVWRWRHVRLEAENWEPNKAITGSIVWLWPNQTRVFSFLATRRCTDIHWT